MNTVMKDQQENNPDSVGVIVPWNFPLPFGGVGESGMGHYHGYEGFVTFSKLRPVFYQAGFSTLKYLSPPYGKLADTLTKLILKIKS
jgi:coniferyl-aldehyde dehydrogenase